MTDQNKEELAKDRTQWAEDRTIMANERTYAGWIRTGLASVGLGLAFHAIFSKLEPQWLPRVLACLFILAGMLIINLARLKACKILTRLSAHSAQPIPSYQINLIAIMLTLASTTLIVGIWMI